MPAPWHVYLLECSDGTLYCGITTDLDHRLAAHNGLLPGGAKYTRSRRPVKLAASTLCTDRTEAARLEIAVRKKPKEGKIAFILAAREANFF